jgi:hypothetical protein
MQVFRSGWSYDDQNQAATVRERESELVVEVGHKLRLDGPPENGRATQQCLKERHWRSWVEEEPALQIGMNWRVGGFERSMIANGEWSLQWSDHAASRDISYASYAHKYIAMNVCNQDKECDK